MRAEKYLNVAEIIGSPSALTQEQGKIVCDKIIKEIGKNNIVLLDFGKMESMTAPFLSSSIGSLYERYPEEKIKAQLKIENFPEEKIDILDLVITNAKKYYKNPILFNSKVQEIIYSQF